MEDLDPDLISIRPSRGLLLTWGESYFSDVLSGSVMVRDLPLMLIPLSSINDIPATIGEAYVSTTIASIWSLLPWHRKLMCVSPRTRRLLRPSAMLGR